MPLDPLANYDVSLGRGSAADLAARLDTDPKTKEPAANLSNAMLVLALDPTLHGLLAHCDFRDVSLLMRAPPIANPDDAAMPGPYPRAWTRADVALVCAYLQREFSGKFKREVVEDAMEAEAARNRFHPIRDWLRTLTWDGTLRLHELLPKGFGTADNNYTRAVGRKLCIAAVRRVRRPGCKFDHVPVAQGPQGKGKSSAFAALFGTDYFSDALPDDLGDKDAAMALRGVWGLEMSELTQLLQSEPEAIKAFVTRAVDRYRPPYARMVIEVPRQGILVGTTNAQEWLRDATGNRRFWPFDCGEVNPAWIRDNRDQLWAEAAHADTDGEAHWLNEQDDRDEAEAMQAERMVSDPWHEKVAGYVDGLISVTAAQLLTHCIEMPLAQQNRAAQMRVTAILTRLGWTKVQGRKGNHWEPPP